MSVKAVGSWRLIRWSYDLHNCEVAVSYRNIHLGLVILTWGVFLASFAMPATDVLVTQTADAMTGWQACVAAVEIPLAHPVALLALTLDNPTTLLLFAVPIVNTILFFSPVFAARRPFSWLYSPLLAVAGIMPWLLPGELLGNLFIGFYCWNGSFWVMTLLCLFAPRIKSL